jgi:hypothetical protein
VVEPLSVDENAWRKKVKKIRPRIDRPFQTNLSLTNGSLRSFTTLLRSCETKLKGAGVASERFLPAATLFKKGCSKYTAAAKNFATMLSVSEPGGGTFVGTPEEKIYNRALDRAFTAQGNGSGLMLLAEQKADQIRQQIEAESGG